MREFIYYSEKARTSGNFQDLKQAGRIDIACHMIIHSFFLSNAIRDDVKLHMIFNGPPDAPKHIELASSPNMQEFLSKKDVSGLISRMLYKYKKGTKNEVFPGCFIEKKSFSDLIDDLKNNGKTIYLLDKDSADIRDINIDENSVFVIGDQEGFGREEKRIREKVTKISIGKKMYFASQSLIVVQNELDRR